MSLLQLAPRVLPQMLEEFRGGNLLIFLDVGDKLDEETTR